MAKLVVEITETDGRAEALAVGGELSVLDEIKLGFSWADVVSGDNSNLVAATPIFQRD